VFEIRVRSAVVAFLGGGQVSGGGKCFYIPTARSWRGRRETVGPSTRPQIHGVRPCVRSLAAAAAAAADVNFRRKRTGCWRCIYYNAREREALSIGRVSVSR